MSDTPRRWLLILLPPVTVAIVLTILIQDLTPGFWIVVSFWLFAYALTVASGSTVPASKVQSLLGASTRLLSLSYLAVQSLIAVGLLLLMDRMSTSVVFLFQFVPAAVAVGLLVATSMSNDRVTRQVQQQETYVNWHRRAVNELERLRTTVAEEHQPLLRAATDDLRYSAVGGARDGLSPFEEEINQAISRIERESQHTSNSEHLRSEITALIQTIDRRRREMRNQQ